MNTAMSDKVLRVTVTGSFANTAAQDMTRLLAQFGTVKSADFSPRGDSPLLKDAAWFQVQTPHNPTDLEKVLRQRSEVEEVNVEETDA